MKRRGRKTEPDTLSRAVEIAARVYQTQQNEKISTNRSRYVVEKEFGVGEDTVRRARRKLKNFPVEISVEAFKLEIERRTDPDAAAERKKKLRERIAEVKKNRGKKRN